MAHLTVRNLSPKIVTALKRRAKRRGVSVEEEHRRILQDAAQHSAPKTMKDTGDSFKEHLLNMPELPPECFPVRQPYVPRDIEL